jgi:hypothetical protein
MCGNNAEKCDSAIVKEMFSFSKFFTFVYTVMLDKQRNYLRRPSKLITLKVFSIWPSEKATRPRAAAPVRGQREIGCGCHGDYRYVTAQLASQAARAS